MNNTHSLMAPSQFRTRNDALSKLGQQRFHATSVLSKLSRQKFFLKVYIYHCADIFTRSFSAGRDVRGLFDCRKLSESCDGIPRCCGGAQCYWENGYSMIKVSSQVFEEYHAILTFPAKPFTDTSKL